MRELEPSHGGLPCTGNTLLAAVLASGLMIGATAVAPGGAADEGSILDEVRFTTGSYVAWRFAVPTGGSIEAVIEGEPTGSSLLGYAVWIWKADSFESTKTGWVGWFGFGGTRAFFEWVTIGNRSASYEGKPNCEYLNFELPIPYQCGYARFSVTRSLPSGGGEWIVLVEGAADGAFDGKFSLRLPAGASFIGRTQGSAFLDREEMFHGELNFVAEVQGRVSLKVMQNVIDHHEFDGSWFGFFRGSSDTDLLEMGYDGPDGPHDGERLYVFEDALPGRYGFRVDFDVETKYQSIIAVVGAVVVLP